MAEKFENLFMTCTEIEPFLFDLNSVEHGIGIHVSYSMSMVTVFMLISLTISHPFHSRYR